MIRALLFDWTGTLVRTVPSSTDPLSECAAWLSKTWGREITPDELKRASLAASDFLERQRQASNVHLLAARILDWLGLPAAAEDSEALASRLFETTIAGHALYDDARALLPALRYRGVLAGVVTNSLFSAAQLKIQVQRLGIAGYLHALVSSADLGVALPEPAVYKAALRALDVEPFEALYVGSQPALVRGANAARLRSVLLVRDGRARDHAGFLAIERLTALNDLLGGEPGARRGHSPLL